jgi:hypothetical protein
MAHWPLCYSHNLLTHRSTKTMRISTTLQAFAIDFNAIQPRV